MTKVGDHITLDIIGTTKEYDPSIYEKVIQDIARAAKVTILNISKYKFDSLQVLKVNFISKKKFSIPNFLWFK